MTRRTAAALFAAITLAALAGRAARLDLRPMHHDEANQAVKFGGLLEAGDYRYDPRDHHGPSLYYFSWPIARALGRTTLASLDETVLRLVPALFGTGTILLLLLLGGALSRPALVFGGLFLAASPAMLFYGRFYIQETLLVFFLAGAIGAGWRFYRTRSPAWAALTGLCCGLMFATKETSVILFAAMAAAVVVARGSQGAADRDRDRVRRRRIGPIHILAFAGASVTAAAALFSSLFTHWRGLPDSILAFTSYADRAAGGGLHDQPFGHYLRTLAWFRTGGGPVWSEGFLLALALLGLAAAFTRPGPEDGSRTFARFLAVFTILTVLIYSLIPYKTPWNILPFHFGIILLAGIGAAFLWRAGRRPRVMSVAAPLILAAGTATLALQAWRAGFAACADPRNPYVYAQTVPDYQKLVRRLEDLAAASPDGRRVPVKVVAPPDETWPLPWSLRTFERVGYWTGADAAGDVGDAAVVIASAGQAAALEPRLDANYQAEHYGLRPEVPLVVFIRRDLWEAFLESRDRR